MLPHEGCLWIIRVGLIVSLVVHVYAAVTLWRRAGKARTVKYVMKKHTGAILASRMMRWGGADAAAVHHLAPAELHGRQGQRDRRRDQRPLQPAGRHVRDLVDDAHLPASRWPCSARTCTTASGAPAQTLGLTNNARARAQRQAPRLVLAVDHRRRLLARPDLRPRRRHRLSKESPHMTDMPDTTLTSDPSRTSPATGTTRRRRRLLHARRADRATPRRPAARSTSAGQPASSRPGWSTRPTAASSR